MARIPDEEIQRIKQATDLAALARSRGVELTKHGSKDWVGRCPFHTEDTASFIVSPDKGLFHCMGCGAAGNAIQFLERFDGVSFRHAFELLSEGRAAFTAPAEIALKRTTVPRLENPFDDVADDAALLARVVEFYHERLLKTPAALDYLKGRGLYHEEAMERFRFGFGDRTLGLRLPEKNRKAGAEIRERLQKLGLLRESGHEHFCGSVTMPIYKAGGGVGEIYGRKIGTHLPKGAPPHLYLQGPHEGIWNIEALNEPEIVLCEAPFDALTFWVHGFRNVTFIYGTEGFTDELFDAILARKIKRIRIAYDADEAGDRAAKRDAQRLGARGIEVYRVSFPRGMDANEYARKVPPAASNTSSLAALLAAKKDKQLSVPSACEGKEPLLSPPVVACETGIESLPAGALLGPPAPRSDIPAEIRENEVMIVLGDRRWRIRGLAKNLSYEVLKVNLLVGRGEVFHVDNVDLYSARQRGSFTTQAAGELNVENDALRRDLGRILLKLEELQDAQIRKTLEPKAQVVEMTEQERAEAMAFLEDPRLIERIGEDYEACGLVGEETGRLVCYLLLVSRLLEKPFAVLIQSSSAAGKSALMTMTLLFAPEESRVHYSAVTGQSLYYIEGGSLRHKVLAISEEEGAERASYALKLLQSEGKISIASTGKDPATGRHVAHEYRVDGPTGIILTTTAIDLDEELLNRCIVVTVDEGREQTRAIHRMQRERYTLEGLLAASDREEIRRRHQNAQRLLRPLEVLNPHARRLTFLDDKTRTRRDHEKYLTLIAAIALLHQCRRPIKTREHRGQTVQYIEATLDDIALANRLAAEVLGRTLDELPPQTRRFLQLTYEMVAEKCRSQGLEQCDFRYSRREILDYTGWSYPQVRKHLERLIELEYVLVHRGSRGQSFVYELLWDGQGRSGERFLIGLIDVETLRKNTTTTPSLTPSETEFDPSLTRHLPPIDPRLHDEQTPIIPEPNPDFGHFSQKNAYTGLREKAVVIDTGNVIPLAACGGAA